MPFNKSHLYLLRGTALWKHLNTFTTGIRVETLLGYSTCQADMWSLKTWTIFEWIFHPVSCSSSITPCSCISARSSYNKFRKAHYLLPQGELPPGPPGASHSDTGHWINHPSSHASGVKNNLSTENISSGDALMNLQDRTPKPVRSAAQISHRHVWSGSPWGEGEFNE